MTRRLAILAQYDPDGGLPAHVRLHLEGLRPVVERLILVSNSPLDTASLDTANSICDRVLVRENTGWDFAAWRDVLACESTNEFDWVILTNSSVIGPLYPLGPIFEKMEARTLDFWGMVMSLQKKRHLQSYFISLSGEVAKSEAWKYWWSQVDNIDDKNKVIRNYEIRLTEYLSNNGFEAGSFVDNPVFPKSIRMVSVYRYRKYFPYKYPFNVNYTNRSVGFYEELIAEGMPYLRA